MGQLTVQVRAGVGGHFTRSEGMERAEFSFCSECQLTFSVLRGVVGAWFQRPAKGTCDERKGGETETPRRRVGGCRSFSLCNREEKERERSGRRVGHLPVSYLPDHQWVGQRSKTVRGGGHLKSRIKVQHRGTAAERYERGRH